MGETIAAPLGALAILALGAGALLVLPLSIAWVAGRVAGLFDAESSGPVQSWVVILVVGAFLLTFAINSPQQAAARHAVWRGAEKST